MCAHCATREALQQAVSAAKEIKPLALRMQRIVVRILRYNLLDERIKFSQAFHI